MSGIQINPSGMDRIEVESLNLVASYSLKAGKCTNDECLLCKQNLLAPSIADLQIGNLKVMVSVGACNHCFHKTCIDAHTSKGNISCPICKTPWTSSRNISVPNCIIKPKP